MKLARADDIDQVRLAVEAYAVCCIILPCIRIPKAQAKHFHAKNRTINPFLIFLLAQTSLWKTSFSSTRST